MIVLAQGSTDSAQLTVFVSSVVVFLVSGAAVLLAARPVVELVRAQHRRFDVVLRQNLMMDVDPRVALFLSGVVIVLAGLVLYFMTASLLGGLIGLVAGAFLPSGALRYLRVRRLRKLEDQLVGGIQTLASGVRAGLNLIQAMELVAEEGPDPLKQEFVHLLREYEYGVPLEEAMDNAAHRIGSGDYRLLFSALQTHRQRGGNLGETLDRIAASIREIQRLEGRTKALTAQGRATARWLGAMPIIVVAVLYFFVDPAGVKSLFADAIGKIIVVTIVGLNVIGFLWVKKVVSIDV